MFAFFYSIVGVLFRILYSVINNYGLALLIFTLFFRLIIMPTNIKQQKSSATQVRMQPKLKRIRAKYPDLVIQCCASGGGRVNYGLMPYFDEFWVSDNTDAKQRLFIQWGTSMFFPACAMAQHVSASPNHQTHRTLPLKFRFDVAMTGRLGMEMKP